MAKTRDLRFSVSADVSKLQKALEHADRQVAEHSGKTKRELGQAGRAYDKYQREAKQKIGLTGRAIVSSTSAATKRIVGMGAALAGIGGGVATLKSAVNTTTALAKGTAGLNRVTDMGIEESSRWVAVMRSRGVETQKLNMGFTTLSKQIVAARSGNEAAAQSFEKLGVSQRTLATGDTRRIVGDIADGMAKLSNANERAALASKLFGKSYQVLLPLIADGSASLEDALAVSDKYGTTLSGKQLKAALKVVGAQREMNLAMDGLKVKLGTALLPAMLEGTEAFGRFYDSIRKGRGLPGRMVGWIKSAFDDVKSIFDAGMTGFKGVDSDFIGPLLPDNRSFAEKLVDGLTSAFKSVNWGETLDLSSHISTGLNAAFGNIDTQSLAETITLTLLKVFNTALDPVFWFKHIDDVILALMAFSKISWLRNIKFIGPVLGKMGDFIWKGLGFVLKGAGRLLWGAAKEIGELIIKGLGKLPGSFASVAEIALKAFWRKFTSWFEKLRMLGADGGSRILDGFETAGRGLVKLGGWLIGKLWSGIKAYYGRLFSLGKSVADRVRDGVASLWKRFYSIGGWLLEKIKHGLIDAPLSGLKNLGKKIGDAIGSGIGTIKAMIGIGGAGLAVGSLGNDKGNFGKVTSLARKYGNIVTSGFRPGDDGWHGKNKARDYAGGNMLGFARAMASTFGGGLLELIHTPLGFGIKNGRKVANSFFGPAVMADHYDHVHVAMRTGGARGGRGRDGVSPKLVTWDEGNKREWWISQEGDRKTNIGHALEALQTLAGDRLKFFKGGGKLGAAAIKSLWLGAGGSKKLANIMTAIALAESAGDSKAHNTNTNGTIDEGLWQINSVHGFKNLRNAARNATAAVSVFRKQGLGAWVTYNTGAYRTHLAAARKADPKKGKSKSGILKAKLAPISGALGDRELVDAVFSAGMAEAEYSGDKGKQAALLSGRNTALQGELASINDKLTRAKKPSYRKKLLARKKEILDELSQNQSALEGLTNSSDDGPDMAAAFADLKASLDALKKTIEDTKAVETQQMARWLTDIVTGKMAGDIGELVRTSTRQAVL